MTSQRPAGRPPIVHRHGENGGAPEATGFWRSKAGIAAIGFILIAGFLLLSEHQAHALGYLPFLLLLACPFLHMFMHRGHGGHDGHREHPRSDETDLSRGA